MTAAQMALVANCNRDPRERPRPFSADDFNPWWEPPPPRPVDELKRQLRAAMGL